ncbi:DNA-dependent metalloprotease WSS1 [Lecanosticta acicola]|uniref:DNA-dependent metalloprotease WSS1 n=1 Tax=Lecanosticta acicola TaxID=111012 RepID=A0AAI9EC50_9PEZI|nr:DNA-dependent metalloprotease WSS1 [Lecanosticta acicola]
MSWHPGGPVGNPYAGEGFSGRNKHSANGGPSGVQRSYASQLQEKESLFTTYEHLNGLERGDAALTMLRKVASIVKPIMRKRGWRVQVLAEFLPPENNLLGLNINKGYKICLRLRYHNNSDLFLPLEDVVDTLLHELSHNVWGEHDSNFHKLWDELRDEHEALIRKGYTGEGFMSEGKRLGGSGGYQRPLPLQEMRQRARANAEKRKAKGTLSQDSGQRLGGTPLHLQGDVRNIIADQVTRRNTTNKGCGSGRKDADKLSQQAAQNSFASRAEEDDANNRAISRALEELMEEEEAQKLNGTFKGSSSEGLDWSPEHGLYNAGMKMPPHSDDHGKQPSEEEQMKWALEESLGMGPASSSASMKRGYPGAERPEQHLNSTCKTIKDEMINKPTTKAESEEFIDLTSMPDDAAVDQWACEVCTLVNPIQFLSCDACGVERPQSVMAKTKGRGQPPARPPRAKTEAQSKPRRKIPEAPKQPESMGWNCTNCRAFMEHKWWTCSACGVMKIAS